MSYPELTGGIFCSITVKQNQKKKKKDKFSEGTEKFTTDPNGKRAQTPAVEL